MTHNADVVEHEAELLTPLSQLLTDFVGYLLSLGDQLAGIKPGLPNIHHYDTSRKQITIIIIGVFFYSKIFAK